jgi:hypothetical protein
MALIVIPYFNINIEAEGFFLRDRKRRTSIFAIVAIVLTLFLLVFQVYVAIPGTVTIATLMAIAAYSLPQPPSVFRRYLASKPLSFWIMTWFLIELVVLTAVGTFFRGPGWSPVWPWQSY